MIVTLEAFRKGQLKLPNAFVSPNGADSTNDIQAYIDRFEREILILGLGPTLYNLIKAQYTGTVLSPDAPQRIKDLINGETYESNGMEVTWEGLVSFPAYYIFYKYWNDFDHIKRDNDETIDDAPKAVRAYQEFYEKYQGTDPGPRYAVNAFGSYGLDWYGSRNVNRSLYQYLQDKETIYPEAQFTPITTGNMNSMGI